LEGDANILKGKMESGEVSRGKESIRAEGSIMIAGNFNVDVAIQQRVGHVFGPLPPEMRNAAALLDRIMGYPQDRHLPPLRSLWAR
jgi:ATP-dependent Lon protease